jgi:hypothetical protein
MVDPTGLSFPQPKGGLKRGETLADELKTKQPKANEPITKEPEDRASQASACDDGEARSKRRRTTSAPQAAALAAKKVEAKRVASTKFTDEEEGEATRLRAKKETAEAARLAEVVAVTARVKAEEKATAKLAAEKADAVRVAAEEEVARVRVEEVAEAARLAEVVAEAARVKAEEEVVAKLAAEKTEAARVADEEEVARVQVEEVVDPAGSRSAQPKAKSKRQRTHSEPSSQNLDHMPNKQRRVGASTRTLQRSATVVVERGLATKSRLAGSADEMASIGGRMPLLKFSV